MRGSGAAPALLLPALLLCLPARAFEPRLPGATEVLRTSEGFGAHAVATGPARPDPPLEEAEGAVARTVWSAEGATTAALLSALRAQLDAEGYEMAFGCAARACGGFDFRFAIDVTPPPAMFVDLADFRYLSARRGEAWVTALASRAGDVAQVQVTAVLPSGAETGTDAEEPAPVLSTRSLPAMPAAPAGPVTARLAATGRAVLSDLAFATGSSELAGDHASLAELAAALDADPSLTVALVGHTDAEGGTEGNLAISRRRAEAARRLLVERHGVAPGRVEARGIGYFAPLARNDTAQGRAANRRVEAVVTSTGSTGP